PTHIPSLSLHDALPISHTRCRPGRRFLHRHHVLVAKPDVVWSGKVADAAHYLIPERREITIRRQRHRIRLRHGIEPRNVARFDLDRKSTRLNSSHRTIS